METHQEITTEWKGILNFEGNWADFYPEFLKNVQQIIRYEMK